MYLKSLLRGCAALAVLTSSALTAQAAYIIFDLKSPTSSVAGGGANGEGNQLTYTDLGSGLTLTVRSFANTGASGVLAEARTDIWGGGLGVCNTAEIAADNCAPNNHAMDNYGQRDFLLFTFGGVDVTFDRLKIGWSSNDADVSYWVGQDGNPPLLGSAYDDATLAGLDFGAMQYNDGSSSRTFDLSGTGFSLLVAARLGDDRDRYKDYVKIEKLKLNYEPDEEGQVPEPATLSLVGGALIGLAIYRRRRNG